MMIKCPECGVQVSDKAEKCPKCAYPISKMPSDDKVQTIQQTSKSLKKELIIAVVIMIVGFILLMATAGAEDGSSTRSLGISFGSAFTLIGIIFVIIVKIKIWWRHK